MARGTYGLKLSIWDASAYKQIKGLTGGRPPVAKADELIDATSHDSTGGYQEFIQSGLKAWDDVSFEMNHIETDPGQVFAETSLNSIQKFKVEQAGVTAPRFFNALVKSFDFGDEQIKGKGTRTLVLTPTGAPPVS
jgi:hypothetical protein